MRCSICGRQVTTPSSVIGVESGQNINVCRSCHGDVYRDGLRYDVDVMIVPVKEESFKVAIREGKYAIPTRYIRKRRAPKCIAFYRGGGIRAITHIAKVLKIDLKVPKKRVAAILKSTDPDSIEWMESENFLVFELDRLATLKREIPREADSPPIQNRSYKTFERFASAHSLADLLNKQHNRATDG